MKNTLYSLSVPVSSPLRLALASDLHNFPCEEVLEALRENHPDLICIPGDFLKGNVPDDPRMLKIRESVHSLKFLTECPRIAPTFCSLGNHEWMLCRDDLNEIRKLGIHVLDNSWEPFAPSGPDGILSIGGLTSAAVMEYRSSREASGGENGYERYPRTPKRNKSNSSWAPESAWLSHFEKAPGIRILLSHHPEYWALKSPYLNGRKITLVLSGHAHGGQIRFIHPFRKKSEGLFAPGQGFFPRYTSGVHAGPSGTLIISRGLSNTAKLVPRLFNPTELVLIDLAPA